MKIVDEISAEDFDNISQKIHKLEALKKDSATTPEQAANYAAIVQKLLFKYNLSLDQLAPKAGEKRRKNFKKEDVGLGVKATNLKQWKVDLFRSIAETNFCKVLNYSNSEYIVLIGEPENVSAVKSMYAYLEYEIRALGRNAFKLVNNRSNYSQMDTLVWKGSFRDGAVATVRQRLVAQQKADVEEANTDHKKRIALETGVSADAAMGTAGTALVVQSQDDLNEAVYEFFPSLRPAPPMVKEDGTSEPVKYKKRRGRPRGSGKYNSAAYWAGVEAGKSVQLNKAVGKGAAAALNK